MKNKKRLTRKQKREMKLGTQILYVPEHANGDTKHFDVEYGFVTSVSEAGVCCRYWKNPERFHPRPSFPTLRTKFNSELTPFDNLIIKDSVNQSFVEKAIRHFCSD